MKKTLLALLTALPFVASATVIIDVRSAEEHAQGHIDQAHLLPVTHLESGIAAITTDKNEPIYLYCRSDRRAQTALETLQSLGYTQVHNIGGFSEAQEYLEKHPHILEFATAPKAE